MGVQDKIIDGVTGNETPRRKGLPPNATFRLTAEGRAKLQSGVPDAKSRVLMAVEGEESYTTEEVSSRARIPRGRVERILETLVKQRYVQVSGGGSNIAEEGLEE